MRERLEVSETTTNNNNNNTGHLIIAQVYLHFT